MNAIHKMPDDDTGDSDDSDGRKTPESPKHPLARYNLDYAEVAKTAFSKVLRDNATTVEMRSARGLCIGGLIGALILCVLLPLAGVIVSPPMAVGIVLLVAGVGWSESRYRGHREVLPDRKRLLADEYYEIYSREIRAIKDGNFPPNEAQKLCAQAHVDYRTAMRTLNPPSESEPQTPTEPDNG
jgi:hypothetical protein